MECVSLMTKARGTVGCMQHLWLGGSWRTSRYSAPHMQPTYTPVVAAGMAWLDVKLADAKASCSRSSGCQSRTSVIAIVQLRSLITTGLFYYNVLRKPQTQTVT